MRLFIRDDHGDTESAATRFSTEEAVEWFDDHGVPFEWVQADDDLYDQVFVYDPRSLQPKRRMRRIS